MLFDFPCCSYSTIRSMKIYITMTKELKMSYNCHMSIIKTYTPTSDLKNVA